MKGFLSFLLIFILSTTVTSATGVDDLETEGSINTIVVDIETEEYQFDTSSDISLDYQTRFKEAEAFLKENGFDSSRDMVLRSLSEPLEEDIEKVLGFNLTPDEIEELYVRDELIDNIPNINKEFESFLSDSYGGHYYESEDGALHILTTDNPEEYSEKLSNYENIKLKQVDISQKDLEESISLIAEKMKKETLEDSLVRIDYKKNKIIVDTPDVAEVNEIIYNQGEDNFEVNFKERVTITPFTNLFSGVRIDNNTRSGACSTGFKASSHNSELVAVTAGHCSPYNLADEWGIRRSLISFNAIGNWAGKIQGDVVNADAGYITLNNDVNAFPVIRGNNHSDIPVTSVRIEAETQGLPLYKQGGKTNRTSGSFYTSASFPSYPDPQMGAVTNQGLIADMEADHGDSGGTIYRLKADGTAELVGILGGEVSAGSDAYIYYSRIGEIYQSLGLRGIYLAQ